jgi:protein-tyrosine kinase
MSLIQRAMQDSGVVVSNRPDDWRKKAPLQASPPRVEPVPFSIDFRHIAAEGFVSPADPSSRLANEISSIKRRLLRRMGFFKSYSTVRQAPSDSNIVIVTSAMPGEGKTFTATNLALSLAMDERLEVLLIDADFARSSVGETFGLRGRKGVLDRLENPRLSFSEIMQQARDLPLAVIPTGSCRMPVARIFAENAFGAFLEELASVFSDRLIIIDSPPLLATTEAAVLAEHANQVILVIEAGRSTKDTVSSALELIGADEKVCMVLNRAFMGGPAGTRYYGSYRDAGDALLQDDSAKSVG